MASYYLDTEYDFNFSLAGINCHDRDYRLAWYINRTLEWKLVRVDDILSGTPESAEYYSCFQSLDEENKLSFSLISNKTPGGVLYADLAHFDYILKIENSEQLDSSLLSMLRRIRMISACYRIELESLRSRYQLFNI